jgi:hypothetical protein
MRSELQRLDYRHVPKVANQTEHRHWSPKGCFASSTMLVALDRYFLIFRGTTCACDLDTHHRETGGGQIRYYNPLYFK